MQNNYSNLEYSVNHITRNVDSQISSITDRVEEILKSQNDLTASYSTEIIDTDYAAGTITFGLRAIPKTYTQGMTALFTATGESSGKVEGVLGEGNEFSAQLTCALTDSITLSVVFDTGDKQETQLLDNYWYLLYESYDNVIISSGLEILLTDNGQLWQQEAQVMVTDDNGYSALNTLQDLRLGLFRDQKLLEWYQPLAEQESDDMVDFALPENVDLEEGVIYCVAAILTDQYGRTWVDYNSTAVTYNKESCRTEFADTNYSTDPAEWQF
jgi:hypothetical protein